jgi:hypothetical protein
MMFFASGCQEEGADLIERIESKIVLPQADLVLVDYDRTYGMQIESFAEIDPNLVRGLFCVHRTGPRNRHVKRPAD